MEKSVIHLKKNMTYVSMASIRISFIIYSWWS